jgi:hypothetical protein
MVSRAKIARAAALAAVLLLALIDARTAAAAPGSLSLTIVAAPAFTANLDVGDQTATYLVSLTVADTRGTGVGWNLTATSTTYKTTTAPTRTLPTTASKVTDVTAVCASGTCTNPTNAVAYPVAVPAGTTAPAATKMYNAAAGTGLGTFTVAVSMAVTVPQNSFKGSYTSALTLTAVSGP